MSLPLQLKTLQTISQSNNSNHNFDKFTYSSFCLLTVALLYDVMWILLMKNSYLYISGANDPASLSGSMSRYNHYVVYVSYIVGIAKLMMLLLLTKTVSFEWRNLYSRFNFYLNFIRFASSSYIDQVVNPNF